MKSRYMLSALAFMVVMVMTTNAFAQGEFRVTSGTEARGRNNGYAETSGGITLRLIDGNLGGDESGTVVIEYGVPIANAIGDEPETVDGVVTDNLIDITVCNDTRLTGTEAAGANRAAVSKDKNTLMIHVETCTGDVAINVNGVLLSLVGAGPGAITASISNSGDVRLLNDETVVIRSVVDPLSDATVEVAKSLVLVRHTGEPPEDDKAPTGKFMMVIEEAHADSFKGASLNLAFSGIPTDTTVALDFWITGKANFDKKATDTTKIAVDAAQNSAGEATVSGTATGNEATIMLMGSHIYTDAQMTERPDGDTTTPLTHGATMLSDSAIDVVIVRGVLNYKDTAARMALLPLSLDIQATVDVGPIQSGRTDTTVPRFASDETTAMTVIDSTSAQTMLLAPFVVSDGRFDTGIAVSNTSSGQAGAVHFKLYTGGQEISHSTPDMLGPQSTMSMLLSDMLVAAGHTGTFNGYMTITTDFTDGAGQVYISDFAGFSSVVVLQ